MGAERAIRQAGERLGGYEVLGVLGVGGTGVVYRARQHSLDRTVALKVLDAGSQDRAARERFRREGLHAAALEHPNIVPVYDSGEDDGAPFLAMRLVEGGTLADRMTAASLPRDEALRVLAAVADALDAAHAAGLVHRDVKPQNVLLGPGGHPYLADFGAARGGGSDLTRAGGFVGSVAYASPEQIRGEPPTPASDVYALGGIAYQCLSGEVPYPRDSEAGVLQAHLADPPPVLGEGGPASGVLARALAKDPAERPASAGALVAELRHALAGGAPAEPPSPPVAVPAADPPAAGGVAAGGALAGSEHTVIDRPRPVAVPEGPVAARDPRVPWVLAGAAAIAVALVLLAWLLAPDDDAPAPRTARAAALRLAYPAGVVPRRDDPGATPGLALTGVTALGGPGGLVVRAGRVAHPIAPVGALPLAFARALAGGRQLGVRLPLGPAARHTAIVRGSGNVLRAYLVTTAAEQDVVACTAPPSLRDAAVRCDAIVARTRLAGAKALAPGADPDLSAGLAKALGPVATRSTRGLGDADLARRAAPARRLATVDATAAAAVAKLRARPGEQPAFDAVHDALVAEQAVLTRLSSTARAADRGGYDAARGALTSAGRRLRTAFAALRAAGYPVRAA